ncbi:hypothetical protein PMAYCL1PPCAC_12283 [Pristionchus mayeri]|uniref:Uncharacterized protein n=1 Tax=Pristionchus mayeri TaxID=1317129 RepID=A0AAN4ZP68_9BILA|nr:hypothetical protein PMAYCL1PPCAC_12283 [Pristionchus mayeri]
MFSFRTVAFFLLLMLVVGEDPEGSLSANNESKSNTIVEDVRGEEDQSMEDYPPDESNIKLSFDDCAKEGYSCYFIRNDDDGRTPWTNDERQRQLYQVKNNDILKYKEATTRVIIRRGKNRMIMNATMDKEIDKVVFKLKKEVDCTMKREEEADLFEVMESSKDRNLNLEIPNHSISLNSTSPDFLVATITARFHPLIHDDCSFRQM